jgi:hypothetical protein
MSALVVVLVGDMPTAPVIARVARAASALSVSSAVLAGRRHATRIGGIEGPAAGVLGLRRQEDADERGQR